MSVCFGFWEFNNTEYFAKKGCSIGVRDLMRNKDLIFIDKHYFTIWSALTIITLMISWKITIFFLLAPAGYFHVITGTLLNTLGHANIPGSYRNYNLEDKSYNNWILMIPSFGESLHNNHHGDQTNSSVRRRWFEIDITGLVIKLIFLKKPDLAKTDN
jgi:fatty-acid desaturase